MIVKLFDIIEHGLEKTVTIDWKHTITFNPTFGPNLEGGGKGGIKIPAYGKYGGPQISGPGKPVDKLDALFKKHDDDIGDIGTVTGEELVEAHAKLINGIIGSEDGKIPGLKETQDGLLVVENVNKTPLTGDAEATLYAGVTIFALTAELAQGGFLGELETALDPSDPDPRVLDDVSMALQDAWRYMERGLEEAPSAGKGLHGAFQLFEKEFDALLDTPDPFLSSGSLDLIA